MPGKTPDLTVFATLYNVAEYLPRFFECMEKQTYEDFILLLIDDGSEDDTLEICFRYAEKDPRIRVIHLDHVGIAAARNRAISMIETPFVASVDGDDIYGPDYLKHLVDAREKYDADLAISRIVCLNEKNEKTGEIKARGELYIPREQFTDMLPVLLEDRRLNYLYAKLFRSEILKETYVEAEVKQGSDTMFCCQYVIKADSIVLTDDLDTRYIKYTSRSVTSYHGEEEFQRLCRIQRAITEIFRNSGFLTEQMQRAIDGRVLQSGSWALSSIAKSDYSIMEALDRVNGIFHSEEYMTAYSRQTKDLASFGFLVVDPKNVVVPDPPITGHIIVSMTSYPARIQMVSKVLETVFSQSRKADRVILWLAEDQFPEKTIPRELTAYVNEGKLEVRWCDDLMSHKKYYYAFREFPNDLVITIDDDLLYSPQMIETLYKSYLVHPRAVSALRAHFMILDNGRLLPYVNWLQEYSLHIGEESMMLFSTTGAGTLFPTYLFNSDLLDADAIRQTCIFADDIWLKLMQIEANVPVVLAASYAGLHYLPNSQEQSLFQRNHTHNDEQLRSAIEWYDRQFGRGYIMKKLQEYADILDSKEIINEYYAAEIRRKNAEIRKKTTKINRKNEEIGRKNREIKANNARIKELENEVSKLQNRLNKAKHSWSMKIGRTITWPGRLIRDLVKKHR